MHEENSNIQIIILTMPGNIRSINEKVTKSSLDYVDASYKTNTILDAAALITQLDLIIILDTSIAQIVPAFNKPIVTIHENNQDSYQLFSLVSTMSKTVFSNSKKSLKGYPLDLLLSYSKDIISRRYA